MAKSESLKKKKELTKRKEESEPLYTSAKGQEILRTFMTDLSYDTILTSSYFLDVNQVEEQIEVGEEEAKLTIST